MDDEKDLNKSDPEIPGSTSTNQNLVKREEIAFIFGRYKCCAHNVGHVLLDEVLSIYRHLHYYGLLNPKKYRVTLFLENLKNSEYFYLVVDNILSWDALPTAGCFSHVIGGSARMGYYNPYDWHKGMKDNYDVLVRAPKSSPFHVFTSFRDWVLRKYRVATTPGWAKIDAVTGVRKYNVTIFVKDAWRSENCCVLVNADEVRDLLRSKNSKISGQLD